MNEEVVEPPSEGMQFRTSDDVYEFYRRYAYFAGFGIIKSGGNSKEKSNRKPRCLLRCHKYGITRTTSSRAVNERNRLVVKKKCPGSVTAVFEQELNAWVIRKVDLNHNHMLCPDYSYKLRNFRLLGDHVKRQLELNENAGVPIIGNINAVTQLGGGEDHCGFTERDARNYVAKIRRMNLGKGDAEALMSYFRQMQDRDPNFYYVCSFDEENRLEKIFWADSVSRESYKYFGDVVSFDATYIVNK